MTRSTNREYLGISYKFAIFTWGGKVKTLAPIIANDSQIYRVTIEKRHPPKQSRGLGHLVIKNYKNIG